jgi:hypothetical protein
MKLLLLLGAVALGVAWIGTQHKHAKAAEARYAAVAGSIAGRPVRIHCQGTVGAMLDVGSEAGAVTFHDGQPENVAHLKRFVCNALARVPGDLTKTDFSCVYGTFVCSKRIADDIQALHTLAHESSHLAGEQSEAGAECRGLLWTSYVAERFGAGPRLAGAIAHWAATHIYPQLPDDYKSACVLP